MSEDATIKQQNNTRREAKVQRKKQSNHPARQKYISIEKVSPPDQSTSHSKPTENFKNLKRETEIIDVVKDEVSRKYDKKEIQSNWSKYEIKESYDQVEEQQNLGADYVQLSQTPLCISNHFQFKHEKAWDTAVTPSVFDHYFHLNLSNLALAINSVPFYKRNTIDSKIFSKSDYSNMDHSAKKYKQKYSSTSLFKNNNNTSQNISESATLKDVCEADYTLVSEPRDVACKEELAEDDLQALLAGASLGEQSRPALQNQAASAHESPSNDLLDETLVTSKTEVPEMTIQIEKENPIQATKAPQDLEKWLDDFLDS